MIVRLVSWKSDNPVSINVDHWKDFSLLAIIKSTQSGFSGFLKEVLSLTILLQLQIWQKFFMVTSFATTLKSLIRKKLLYCPSCKSKLLPFKWLAIKLFLKAHFQSETIFSKWKPFKNDEKCFLFHLRSSFLSQDILVFVLTFWSRKKTAW